MQTVIKYQDTALPLVNTAVTLFNSVTAFPPGGSFHLLNQQWFQYSLLFDGAAGTITGTLLGQYSNDKGSNWTTFYTSGVLDDDVNYDDEVHVGIYKDVRFIFTVTAATEAATVFNINMALHDCKPTSKTSNADELHNDTALATEVAVDAP
jgi:hypothetical protein